MKKIQGYIALCTFETPCHSGFTRKRTILFGGVRRSISDGSNERECDCKATYNTKRKQQLTITIVITARV